MRKRIKATRKKAKYQQRLRIEALEARNLLTVVSPIQPVEHIIDPVLPPIDMTVHHAPSGANRVVDVASGAPYNLSVADFGFSDPNDTPADTFTDVLIDTLPASGTLQIDGIAVTAGQCISVADIEAGKLQFVPATGSATALHPRMTFQVRDNGRGSIESRNIDPVPKTLVFSFGPNVTPVAQNDTYTVKEGETLNQVRAVNQLDLAIRPSDDPESGTASTYDDFEYSFTANRLYENGIIFSLSKEPGSLFREIGPNLMFAAAHNERFAVGTYENAHGWPYEDPESPVLTVTSSLYSGGEYSGRFTVHRVEYSESGDILIFDASFEAYYTSPFIEETGGSPIIYSGRIQYNIPMPETVSLLQNDVDADSDPLVVVLVAGPQHGTLTWKGDGSFRYVPEAGFNGVDTFQYRAWDGIAESDITTVTINVLSVSGAPTGTSGVVEMTVGAPYVLQTTDFGFSDPNDTPADAFTGVLMTTVPTFGSLTLSGAAVVAGQFVTVDDLEAGNLVYTPPSTPTGNVHDSFSYQVKDSGSTDHGGENLDPDPKTMSFDVIPITVDDVFTSDGTATILDVRGNDWDVEGDPLWNLPSYVSGDHGITKPSHGVLERTADGRLRYTPNPGFWGTDTFQYRLDGIEGLVTEYATVTINVVLPLTATIDLAPDQAGYTTVPTVHFLVVFNQPVVDFTADDVTLPGTGPGTFEATITPVGTDGTTYDVAVSGMTGSGRVFAHIPAGQVHNAKGDTHETIHNPEAYVDYFAQSSTISGTAGNDVFEFFAAPSSAAWIVKVNNRTQSISGGLSNIVIDGISGNDKFIFHGSSSTFTGHLGYEEGRITFGEHVLAYVNMDDITVNGASGSDFAVLYGTSGNDAFVGLPGSAQLTANGKAILVKSSPNVRIASMGGDDSAVMYASRGGSNYLAGPSGVCFFGTGFNYEVIGFKTVSAYAAPGEDNHAVFKSIRDNDLLIASWLGAQYLGDGFIYDVWNLSHIEGQGETGDEARFYGSPGGNTTLNLTPTTAVQTESKLTLKGTGYTKFASYVYAAGNTSATITGTSGNEQLVTSPVGVQLFGTNLELTAWTYKNITVIGGGGEDVANMYAAGQTGAFSAAGATATLTTGAIARTASGFGQVTAHGNAASTATFNAKAGQTNTFNAGPTEASMSGTGYLNKAKRFGTNTGFGVKGGTDVVNYTDSTGDDFFISSYAGSQFTGTGYSNSAWGFATMSAVSAAGRDTARFYGSPTSADSFVGAPGESRHSGQGFASTAKNFARVEAYSNPNARGTAQLTGSTSNDTFVGSSVGAQLWNQDYRVEAWGYVSVRTEGNGGSDMAYLAGKAVNNKLAADKVFAQFSGDGFSNRVEHFATVRVNGSARGTDSATLDHAFLEMGLKEQPTSSNGLTVVRKLWLCDLDEIEITNEPGDNTVQPLVRSREMTAFMCE